MKDLFNICNGSDSYKMSHDKMYLPGTETVYSYFESRSGSKWNETVFFGLQQIMLRYFAGKVVTKEKIDEAERKMTRHLGSYDRTRWEYILEHFNGKLPIKIHAVDEGTPVPINNVMITVENMGGEATKWLTNYVETIITHVWHSSNVATLSREVKKMIIKSLEKTCESGKDFPGLAFMLHDFGYRGTSSVESAGTGGAGHLVNFEGTDTTIAMDYVEEYYNSEVGYSVNATEHSVMTALGKEGEAEVIQNLLNEFPTGILSVVSDSYDIFNCVENLYGERFKEQILNRADGDTFVIRPDSGDPVKTCMKLLEIMSNKFGFTINSKGYKVINPKVRLIWGDGIGPDGIQSILTAITEIGYSAENMVFGAGGALLQKHNRDTQRNAFKCSSQYRNEKWNDVYKSPLDTSKTSKRGRLKLISDNNTMKTVRIEEDGENLLKLVFECGSLMNIQNFEDIRKRASL